jgi:chemotaxis methyl-accepting protein methylase
MYRSSSLVRRLPACLRFLQVADLGSARGKLERLPHLCEEVLDVVLLGVTEFCRDAGVFGVLRSRVVRKLAGLGRPLRVWSAACSDGRELLSMAVLLREAGALEGAHLLGTDFRREAIAQAEAGVYAEGLFEKVRAWCGEFFVREAGMISPREELRRALRWKRADLLQAVEPGPWDVVLWRNMAIYLEREAGERLWGDLVGTMRPGGYLVTGKADNPPPWLPLEKVSACIYQKGGRA